MATGRSKSAILTAFVLSVTATLAQQSASFELREHVLNSGGHPRDGIVFSSAGHRVSLDSLGDGLSLSILSSASFNLDGGFVAHYPPPGEVENVRFTSTTTLVWDPEKSVGNYNLYRAQLDTLTGLAYGACLEPALPDESATDPDAPAAGAGFFYLVTAENRLDEEGTKGFDSNGTERGNPAPCP